MKAVLLIPGQAASEHCTIPARQMGLILRPFRIREQQRKGL